MRGIYEGRQSVRCLPVCLEVASMKPIKMQMILRDIRIELWADFEGNYHQSSTLSNDISHEIRAADRRYKVQSRHKYSRPQYQQTTNGTVADVSAKHTTIHAEWLMRCSGKMNSTVVRCFAVLLTVVVASLLDFSSVFTFIVRACKWVFC